MTACKPDRIAEEAALSPGRRRLILGAAAIMAAPLSAVLPARRAHAHHGWPGFDSAMITGLALLSAQATMVASAGTAPWKLGLLILACLNVLVFHRGIYRRVTDWDTDPSPPGRRPPRSGCVADRMDGHDLCRSLPCLFLRTARHDAPHL